MSFEIALGTLGKALDQLSAMKPPKGGKAITSPEPVIKTAPAVKAVAKAVKTTAAKAAPAPTANKAPKKAAAKAAPAPKAVPVKKAKPAATDGKVSAVAKGRRAVASGERPKLVDAMAIVMGDQQMNAAQVVDALVAKDWAPDAKKPQSYISYVLSANPTVFERVDRGVYRRAKGAAPVVAKTAKKTAAKAAPAAPATTKAPKKAAAKGAPAGKAERVASEEATETPAVEAETSAAAPVVASDPPPSPASDTDDVLSRAGLAGDDDDDVGGNIFAEH